MVTTDNHAARVYHADISMSTELVVKSTIPAHFYKHFWKA